jgi:phage tail tape-measure protein
MTEIDVAMTAPTVNGDAPLPRRQSRGLMPATWINRELRVEYAGADGYATDVRGTLLDNYAVGPVLAIGGGMTLVAWEVIRLIELVGS